MRTGINPRSSAGLSTLAAIVGQYGPQVKFTVLREALHAASEQMKLYEEAVDAAMAEYETESWTEDTQSALAAAHEQAR
jgi:H2-forming N5,N10-methylenetetrahydromethanopterin dehydrogenase-like enzyme